MSSSPSLLHHYRERRGISQSELARRIGCSSSMMSLVEGLRRAPAMGMLYRIGCALELQPEDWPPLIAELAQISAHGRIAA